MNFETEKIEFKSQFTEEIYITEQSIDLCKFIMKSKEV